MAEAQGVADAFTALCKEGKLDEAGETFWSPEVRSLESMEGDMADLRGLDAVRGKGKWWYDNHEVHSVVVTGPFVNHDQFVVDFEMDVTAKADGRRMHLKETAVYTVKDGKIVEERFFMRM